MGRWGKKMKKRILAVILILTLTVSLSACGGTTKNELPTESSEAPTETYTSSNGMGFFGTGEKPEKTAEELIQEIKTSLDELDVETADKLCDELIAMNPDEAIMKDAVDTKGIIAHLCYAGTYIIQPEYIVDVKFEKVDDSMMGFNSVFKDGSTEYSASYRTGSESKGKTALSQYETYLRIRYTYVKSGNSGGKYYANSAGDTIYVSSTSSGSLFVSINSNMVDKSKIDESKMAETVPGRKYSKTYTLRDSDVIVKL